MLARQTIITRPLRTKLTPLVQYSCSLLPLFLRVASFVFNSLQPLLPKTGGWGGLAQGISDVARRTHRFLTPLFPCSYKSLFSQLPSFHIYTKRGVFSLRGWNSRTRIPKSGIFSAPLRALCARLPQAGLPATGQGSALSFILRIFRAVQTFQLSTVDCQPPFPSARMLVTP